MSQSSWGRGGTVGRAGSERGEGTDVKDTPLDGTVDANLVLYR